ncbi:unnamed protein product [Rangifer tarandus platyrhynchus]|uniref:Uncharacterized protein n=2 Tax=Rangifer tarandus platyrhynchus TaxID=3082113 RepID=A0ABN8ZTF3_RANTA|nr:unnamed protein product [Rangifer tarandus platyrhynchus]
MQPGCHKALFERIIFSLEDTHASLLLFHACVCVSVCVCAHACMCDVLCIYQLGATGQPCKWKGGTWGTFSTGLTCPSWGPMLLPPLSPPQGISCVSNTPCPDRFLTGNCHNSGTPEPQTALPPATLM